MSEVYVRPPAGAQLARPVAWVAVTVLGLEVIAGLVGVSVLSYRTMHDAGYGAAPGAQALSRTFVIVALLALVGAALAMAVAIIRHRARRGAPSRPLAWAAIAMLATHVVVVLGCLVRAEWAIALGVSIAGLILAGAWAPCLRHRH
ncbi:hypothetical protein ACTVCO_01110 [Sanguibacter sp. A247]|uniref:hypothetical protein n=1 Tax=unclassified Sanguibacter TaxID=2645534 RepID=UPI003FD6F866